MKIKKEKRDNRKKETHEFFTPPILIKKILAKFPKESWGKDKTWIDPNAGDGNLLLAVYIYKVEIYKHDPTLALETIYGVELMPDNVAEMKLRLMEQAQSYGVKNSDIKRILTKNIVCHDALTYDWSFE